MDQAAAEAVARAREIAAKLSGLSGGLGSDLGKRKNRWEEDAAGLGSIKKKKIYIPVKQYPDVNFLGLLIGPKGSTQKQLQELTGAKILIRGKGAQREGAAPTGHPDDDDEIHVAIEGSDEAIERAVREVEQILFNPEQAMKLKQEQLRTLSGAPNSGSIYGPSSGSGGDEYQEELKVPNTMVGLIIGRGGDNIQKLQFQTGGHIQIAKESDMKPGETHRSIFLKGDPPAVAELRKKIEEIISSRSGFGGGAAGGSFAGGRNDRKELDNPVVFKVPVPNDKVGIIIGKGGMTVKGIQEKTKTTVLIPTGPDEDDPTMRTLSIGADTKEQAEAAHMEIYTVLQQHSQNGGLHAGPLPLQICVPDDKVGIIIGKGGSTVKDIQSRLRVRVNIPQQADPGSNPPVRTCTIVGPADAQQAARYEIEMILQGQSQMLQHNYYGGGGDPQQAAAWGGSYYGYSDPNAYAAQYGAMDPNAAAAYYYGQQQQQQAAAAGAAGTGADGTASAAGAAAAPLDPTAYYNDYWQYAQYYGEAAARLYYGAWSPPEGTPPPPGIVLPGATPVAAPAGDATVDPASERSAQPADTQTATTGHTTSADTTSAVPLTSEAAAAAGSSATTSVAGAPDDPWEAYKKQYAEWYESHGKFIGADPNPPQPQ